MHRCSRSGNARSFDDAPRRCLICARLRALPAPERRLGTPSARVRLNDLCGSGCTLGRHRSVDTGRRCPRGGTGGVTRFGALAGPICDRRPAARLHLLSVRVRALLARESSTATSQVSPTGIGAMPQAGIRARLLRGSRLLRGGGWIWLGQLRCRRDAEHDIFEPNHGVILATVWP